MSLDHKTTERLAPKDPTSLGNDNVVKFDRVFAVQGPKFAQYIAEVVSPVRQDVATMALQQILGDCIRRSPTGALTPDDIKHCVKQAYALADEFCLQAPQTMDTKLVDYFNLYLTRGRIDDIIKASMDAAHDHKL